MKFVGIEKKEQGRFITRYDLDYETEDGQKKRYEIISRNSDIKTYDELHGSEPDAVVLIARLPSPPLSITGSLCAGKTCVCPSSR